jgi:hypothetical protein
MSQVIVEKYIPIIHPLVVRRYKSRICNPTGALHGEPSTAARISVSNYSPEAEIC